MREELFHSTARLIANPVAYRPKAAAIDDLLERAACPLSACRPTPPAARAPRSRLATGASSARPCARSWRRAHARGRRACSSSSGALAATRRAGAARDAAPALDALDPPVRAALLLARDNVTAVARAGLDRRPPR